MNKKDLLDYERENEVWDVEYKGAKYWDYIRSSLTNQYYPHRPKIPKVSFSDVKAFFIFFLYIPFTKRVVFFIPGRREMLDYTQDIVRNLRIEKPIFFIRSEHKNMDGNSFFLESTRHFFRVFVKLFFKQKIFKLIGSLPCFPVIEKQLGRKKLKELTGNFIGDVLFNRFLKLIMKSRIYYSNCVIPKSERSMNLLNSCEIQHGIIHENHPDYFELPIQYSIICQDDFTKDKLIDYGFGGSIKVVECVFKSYKVFLDVIIYTTLSREFNEEVKSFLEKSSSMGLNLKIGLQPHPKDDTDYSFFNNIVYGISPSQAHHVVLGDSTLILQCAAFNKKFFFLNVKKLSNEKAKNKIFSKYGRSCKFVVVNSLGLSLFK